MRAAELTRVCLRALGFSTRWKIPMFDAVDSIRTFNQGTFQARIFLTPTPAGAVHGHVDIYEDQAHRCRIVLTGLHDVGDATALLEAKSKLWVDSRGRDSAAASGFAEIGP